MSEVTTFCRICEPMCGLVATVEGGRVVSVRGDKEHPLSQGFVCVKAAAMTEVTEDVDRVTVPLRRVGPPGAFEPVSWDEALTDIATRLRTIVDTRGPRAYAGFFGNPAGYSAANLLAVQGFQAAMGSPWLYSVNGEDGASWLAASAILFGSGALLPKPDLWRTQMLLILGANPMVSHGSGFSEPQTRKALDSIVERGGRVVVVDPRRTETAQRYEHLAIQPGTDAWLLLGVLNYLFAHQHVDEEFLARHVSGRDELAALVAPFDPARCGAQCDVAPEVIKGLARALAAGPAVAYGRTGTCTQRFGTLNNLLIALVNVVTGNLEREGGAVFGWSPIDFVRLTRLAGLDTYGKTKTRVLGLPDVVGMLPSQGLAPDILTPGEGQIRALMTIGANPAMSSGSAGQSMVKALEELELHFSLDLYMNETNKHAHYILPATTAFERDDFPLLSVPEMLRPTLYATRALVAPRGEAREEWKVLNEIARRAGRGGAYSAAPLRWLSRAGVEVAPMKIVDLLVRTSRSGDWFGFRRSGLSLRKLLEQHPHGVQVRDHLPVRPLKKHLRTPGHRIPLAPEPLVKEVGRLADSPAGDTADYPMRIIGMREVRSQNSWMHNVERLVPTGRTPAALVHPEDAKAAGVADGDQIEIETAAGRIEIAMRITDEVKPGTIAIPHCWGHDGGWARANAAGGGCSNLLASDDPDDIEPLSGMSILNGIPARLRPASGPVRGIPAERSFSQQLP